MKRRIEFENDRMAAEIKGAIECLTTIPTESLSVKVQDHWVYLSGALSDRHQKDFLGEVVQHLDGVEGVTNLVAVESGAAARN